MKVSIPLDNRPRKTFAFPNPESWAIANLHHKYFPDICRLLQIPYSETWPQQYNKPAKVRFAIYLAQTAARKGYTSALQAYIVKTMPESLAYERDKGGRPSNVWLNSTTDNSQQNAEPDTNDDTPPVEEQEKDLEDSIVDADTGEVVQIKEPEPVIEVVQVVKPKPVIPPLRYQEKRKLTNCIIKDTQAEGKEVFNGMAHKQFVTLLNMLSIRDHNEYAFPVWLPGPAGSGKTTAAMHVAKVFGLSFYFNGAIDTEYKLLGFTDAGGTFHQTPFYKAYKHGGIYLFDEVDASNPQALVALNAALENGHCAFGNGEIVERHKDCIVVAAANTFGMGATHEYVGRNKLDAATVDRFIMLAWEYDEKLERALADNDEWVDTVQKIRKAVKDMTIKHVVSPRASIRGARMLAAGFDKDTALASTVYKGMTADQVSGVSMRVNRGY